MSRPAVFLVLTLSCCLWTSQAAHADFLEYRLPGSPLKIILEGRVKVGREVRLQHKFGTLYFEPAKVTVHKVTTNPARFTRMKNEARTAKDAGMMFDVAKWALKHALLNQYYEAIDAVLEIDPDHEGAARIKALKERIDQPLPETEAEEEQIKAILDRGSMKIARSNHFIMLHDTNDKAEQSRITGARRRPPRAVERLRLLEQVYETFVMMFALEDVELDIPQERLRVILFREFEDYHDFSKSINPVLTSAVGFWDPNRNVSIFYDNASDEIFKILQDYMDELQDQKKRVVRARSPQAKIIVRNTNTMGVMVSAAQERSDIKVVTHEATHQMAGNTGLLPRHIRIPSWAHEGLATYFETPAESTWSGVGSVNENRLVFYRALASDTVHSNIDFIVTDQIFVFAGSHGSKLHAYAQAWALTHFLMENHFDNLMKYYALLAQMPPDVTLNPDVLLKLFDRAFGEDREAMTLAWRAYMRSLKTDFQKAIDE